MAFGFGRKKEGEDAGAGGKFRHNRAAYAREDVDDSKRGRPSVSLQSYATLRGMRFRDSIRLGAFMSASPIWKEYVFNAMDGALPSGRYGLIEHELDEQALDQDGFQQAGGYYSVRTTWRNPDDWKAFLTYGALGGQKEVPNEPFAGNSGWLPATAVSIRVPQTRLIAPLDVRRKGNFPRFGVRDLGELGAPGFRATGVDKDAASEATVGEALGAGAGAALGECPYPYVRLEVGYGLVTLRRNGFAPEEEIKTLVDRAERIAEAFAGACGRLARPQAFDLPVPPAEPGPELSRKQRALAEIADMGISQAAERIAAEMGLEVEDPARFQQAFPDVVMPGTARLVCRGTLPGTAVIGRIVYTAQGRRAGSTIRGGVLLPAASSAPKMPLGGEPVEATNMYGDLAGDIAVFWDRGRVSGQLGAVDLLRRALATAAELRIAST
ncbi:MAG: hypothetical protein H6533_10670 [Thermoleophilales bacterium]|nr:hypothetical protein [Thermoleophilales bacterium]